MELCPCCSEELFENCCSPFLEGTEVPATPEALMRSRYSAYVKCHIPYLLKTTFESKRKLYNVLEMERWSKESFWVKLEIVEAKGDKVEFKAFYTDKEGNRCVHHEKSTFRKQNETWFYFDGIYK
jgi:SEC-C motif domain protein